MGMDGLLVIRKLTYAVYHLDRLKVQNPYVHLNKRRQSNQNIQHLFIIKTVSQAKNGENLLNLVKGKKEKGKILKVVTTGGV